MFYSLLKVCKTRINSNQTLTYSRLFKSLSLLYKIKTVSAKNIGHVCSIYTYAFRNEQQDSHSNSMFLIYFNHISTSFLRWLISPCTVETLISILCVTVNWPHFQTVPALFNCCYMSASTRRVEKVESTLAFFYVCLLPVIRCKHYLFFYLYVLKTKYY